MMKYLLIASLLWVAEPLFPFNDIAKTNSLIKQAKAALEEERYEEAAENYRVLVDSFGMNDSQLKLNLAHALLKSDQKEEAKNIYTNLSGVLNAAHRSIANQQLGNLAIENEELDAAINFYKSSLKANPENEEARYNYELAKKLKEKQEQDQEQNEDQQEQEQDQEEQQEGEEEKEEGEQGESEEEQQEQEKGEENEETGEEQQQEGEAEQETSEENENPENQEEKTEEQQRMENMQNLKEKLEEMEMNEETAMMILEALRNQEIQYLQQMRRKATQNRKSGKPDW